MEISAADGVEVMRGPETLAYGSNTIAGIINIITPLKTQKNYHQPITNYCLAMKALINRT